MVIWWWLRGSVGIDWANMTEQNCMIKLQCKTSRHAPDPSKAEMRWGKGNRNPLYKLNWTLAWQMSAALKSHTQTQALSFQSLCMFRAASSRHAWVNRPTYNQVHKEVTIGNQTACKYQINRWIMADQWTYMHKNYEYTLRRPGMQPNDAKWIDDDRWYMMIQAYKQIISMHKYKKSQLGRQVRTWRAASLFTALIAALKSRRAMAEQPKTLFPR